MVGGAGRVISTSLLLAAVLVASSSWCLVAAATTPAGSGSVQTAAGATNGDDRGMLARSRFLATTVAATTKQIGRQTCGPGHAPGECSGVYAGAGAAGEHGRHRFRCCGGACTDVLASASSCGACGRRCPFGRLCCGGRCAAVSHDAANCGACGRACAAGTPCTYGMCGYA